MKKELNAIIKTLKEVLPDLTSKYHVASLEIFGSYVRGDQSSNSDLDILVTYSKAPDLFQFIELEYYLSDLIGMKVDLVMRRALKPNIGKRIIAEARLVK